MTIPHQLINQTSGEVEWFTPPQIIEAAVACMGSIDLDPASSKRANIMCVKALNYFDKEDDGLSKSWTGRTVWLNHPFGRDATPKWIKKLLDEYEAIHFGEALTITYASTSEVWFRPLLKYPQCFLHGRTNYIAEDTLLPVRGASKGSVVTYIGKDLGRFYNAFKSLGTVKACYTPNADYQL